MRYTNVPWFLLLQPPHPIPMTPMTGLKGTTGRTNVKPQTFKTAANAALSLGSISRRWKMLMGKRCQPLAQLGPTVWGDLYLYSLYVVFAVKLQFDFLQKADSIHTHHPTVQWALLNVFWICLAWADQPFDMWILISIRTGKDRSGYKTPCNRKPHCMVFMSCLMHIL